MMPRTILLAGTLCGLLGAGCQSKHLVFTTYTKVGLNISATGEVPNNLMFGYKRFEGAIIPVDPTNQDAKGMPLMPSVYAKVGVTNRWLKGLHIQQTFATGTAAEDIAGKE